MQDNGIIPMPNKMVMGQGTYTLQGETSIALSEDEPSQKVFRYLADALKNTTVTLKRVPQTEPADICFLTEKKLRSSI